MTTFRVCPREIFQITVLQRTREGHNRSGLNRADDNGNAHNSMGTAVFWTENCH